MDKTFTGRYAIGEEIYACSLIYETHPRPSIQKPFVFDDEAPCDIKFNKFTVVEHHRVPSVYAQNEELEHDGYVLYDDNGVRFTNQYPRASYGQLSDIRDRVFTRDTTGMSKDEISMLLDKSKEQPYEFVSVDEMLTPLVLASKLTYAVRLDMRSRLLNVIEQMHRAFNQAYPGLCLVTGPGYPSQYGYQDILHTTVKKQFSST